MRTFHALLADERLGRVWLIECDGEPAGYVVLTVSFSIEYGGLRGFVDDLFVRKRFRRGGLAAAALAEVRNACVALGVRALFVESDPDDEGAQRVYRRSGFASSNRLLLTASLAPAVHEADISDTDQEQ
ncbi:MAG: GNAT family N-acetyltransferase [Vicinamibacterales bacterium]